jgi:hypothetical protein
VGLEDFLRDNFGRVEVVILDFFHAAEYLGDLAKALHPQDTTAAEAWRGQWCHRLKHEGGQALLAALRALPVLGTGRTGSARVAGYLANQAHRMDYPSYLAKGWQIGSGPVESACKTVIGQRLKGAACAGVRTGRTRSLTFAPCSVARRARGKHSGPKTNLSTAPYKTLTPAFQSAAHFFCPGDCGSCVSGL